MPCLEAVIFDLGQTVVGYVNPSLEEKLDRGARFTHSFLTERGYALPEVSAFKGKLRRALASKFLLAKARGREINAEEITLEVLGRLNPDIPAEAFAEASRKGFAESVRDVALMPGALEALRHCRERGYVMGIVSNTIMPGWLFREDLVRLGVAEFFKFAIFSSEYGRPKPHVGIFQEALAQAGVHASRAVFVGDSYQADVVGARGAGMKAIWITAQDDPGDADAIVADVGGIIAVLEAWNTQQ